MNAIGKTTYVFRCLLLWEEKRKRDPQKIKAIEPVDGDLTPLHFGAIFGHLEVTELLFQSGFKDVNAINEKDEYTPLHYACQYGHADVATFLISKGAFVNGVVPINRDDCYIKPIEVAAATRQFNVAEVLVQNGADVTVFVASQCGLVNVAQRLLESGADVNAVTLGRKYSALHFAACYGHTGVVKLLLENGVDINALSKHDSSRNKRTALHWARQDWGTRLD